MRNTLTRRARANRLTRNPLALACAAALLLASQASLAQDVPAEPAAEPATEEQTEAEQAAARRTEPVKELESVQVRGIRRGIERAIDIKQNSTSIVESISAEDIGKLPDVSIGESLARLPGLSAQRVAGRAQVVSVRGLSPDFSTSLLNGRELVSTGDNRSVEFDQYPSELLSGVTVYKTPDAGLVGQGLSGTLDMRTVRPLDFQDQVTVVSVRGQHNSLGSAADSSAVGSRVNASFITQNSDRSIGFSIGYSYSSMPIQENQVGLYEPWQQIGEGWRPGVPSAAGCPDPALTDCTYYSDGIKALRRTGDQTRHGVMATLEFRPNQDWTSVLDVFHSQAEQEDTANKFEVHLGGYNGGYSPGLALTNVDINGDHTFVGGVASGVYPLVRGMYNKREDQIDAFGWNNKFSVGAAQIDADISWSRSQRDELNLENNTQLQPAPQLDSVALDFDGGDFPTLDPGRDYSDPATLFLANTIYGSGYGKTPQVDDELRSFRLNANFGAGAWEAFSSFDIGINYADREKSKRQPEGNINLGSQGPIAVGSQFQYGLVDLGFAGVGMIPSWDVPGAVAEYMTFAPNENAPWLISKAWEVNEQITSAWVRGNIDTDWGSVPVRGNIGVQIQRVDQSSTANVWDTTKPSGSEIVRFTNGKTYTDVLPSMNLVFEIAEDQRLRVALARQVARPRVDQLRASLEFGVNTATGVPGAGGGNPLLDPWRANAFDLSWEKYFDGNKGYVAAAFFYKDLRTYIFTQSREYDFSELVATYVPPIGSPPAQDIGLLNGPFNGSGGKLTGLELTASIPLEMLSESLEGFGIIANASFNDSNISIRDPDSASSVGSGDISLPGLSDRVYNFTAYYERNGFEARINQRRRSDFIGEIGDFAANRKLRYVEGENITDAQVSYTFDGAAEGLTVLLQASNLTNSMYHTYAGTKDRPLETVEWGRTYLLGVSYKF